LSGIYVHTQRLPIAIDTNLLPAPFSTVTLANGETVSYRNWNTSPATDPLGGTEGLPCATATMLCESADCSEQPIQLRVLRSLRGRHRRSQEALRRALHVFGNYTFSKGFDTSTDYNTDYGPQDPTNLNADRALSEFDQRHKLVIAGVIDSPWKTEHLVGFPAGSYFRSPQRTSLQPAGRRRSERQQSHHQRTSHRSPARHRSGPRLHRLRHALDLGSTNWARKPNLQFTAEGFDIANRTNYASVNNEVSPLFGFTPGFTTTFNVRGIRPGSALAGGGGATSSTPLAFTSAFPKRQIQLGVRFTF
jgi:hypothetical protein